LFASLSNSCFDFKNRLYFLSFPLFNLPHNRTVKETLSCLNLPDDFLDSLHPNSEPGIAPPIIFDLNVAHHSRFWAEFECNAISGETSTQNVKFTANGFTQKCAKSSPLQFHFFIGKLPV
jgi:hypothetical protein